MALEVDDIEAVFEYAVLNGAKVVISLETIRDKHGTVTFRVIEAYGDTTHSYRKKVLQGAVFFYLGFRLLEMPNI